MRKPLFSIVIICKNEQNTLPRLFDSLKEFQERNGEVVVLDTGSTDHTIQIALDRGAIVGSSKAGEFINRLNDAECMAINEAFVVWRDKPIVHFGNQLFDFAAARNAVSAMASNDFILTMDADEAYTKLDIDFINQKIEEGYENFSYQFVYAHNPDGSPAVQFVQSKAFDRRKMRWEGIVHEILQGEAKHLYVGPEHIMLEHFQEPNKEHRSNYIVGLAYDCWKNPNKDRQTFYLARELMYTGRNDSALDLFKKHVTMKGWHAERAQSYIYMGDIYGKMNLPGEQTKCYLAAIRLDPNRREAYIKLAGFYLHNKNFRAAIAFASAAITIPEDGYYANNKRDYRDIPYSILYKAHGWIGEIKDAQKAILKCLEYEPNHPEYLRDTKYYFEYPDNGIDGWMTFEELTWLYNTAKGKKDIIEIGSWKGRSTHALCSGAKDGLVTAVDTWEGSQDEKDHTHWLAKQEDVMAIFHKNVGHFRNLVGYRGATPGAAYKFPKNSAEVVFIDAGHLYRDLVNDIAAWLPICKEDGIICGHDYLPGTWMSVIEAVDDIFGKPDGVVGSIWYVNLKGKDIEALKAKAVRATYNQRAEK